MSIEKIQHYFPELTDRQIEQFSKLPEIYQEWNEKINVISRKDINEIMERHVLHSLSLARYIHFKKGWYVADLGTGGGFPGIPLAILFPEVKFILIDSIGKKIKVVNAVSQSLELKNVSAIWGRTEEQHIKVNVVVTRAVASLDKLTKWSSKILKPQSQGILTLKGGNLEEELIGFKKRTKIIPIQNYFPEPFFESKYIVHLKP